jgi:hypothetical protein
VPIASHPSVQDDTAPRTDESGSAATHVGCGACRHDVARHDAISLRFCQATQAGALARHCICPAG